MAICPICKKYFGEPEGEHGEHPCPYCGYFPPEITFDEYCLRCEDIKNVDDLPDDEYEEVYDRYIRYNNCA